MLVSDGEQLSICEQAGGEYMITPNVNTSLIRECVRRGLVAMPGAITPSEAVAAYDAGRVVEQDGSGPYAVVSSSTEGGFVSGEGVLRYRIPRGFIVTFR